MASVNYQKKYQKVIVLIIVITMMIATQQASVFAGSSSSKAEKKEVPVLLYHHLDNWGKVADTTVTSKKFEKDMKYLKDNNYTSLLPQDILDIREGKMKMPEKPVMITFDDGYESNYSLAYPILKEYEMKATIFVITVTMNKKNPKQIAKLTWEQMKEMYDSGLVDIQSHGYDLHNSDPDMPYSKFSTKGVERTFIESQHMYNRRIALDTETSKKIIEENVGNEVFAYAYPYGIYDEWCVEPFEKSGIKMGFILGGINADITSDLLTLNRIYIDMDSDIDAVMKGYGVYRDTYGALI